MKKFPALLILPALCASLFLARGQSIPATGADKIKSFRQQQDMIRSSPFAELRWRNISPDQISGRCTEVEGVSGKRNFIYAAFAIGSFALAPSNQNIIYLGTGEANIFRASLPGR
jgi:hypothetical protein